MGNFWKDIYDKKGNSSITDLLYLDGYEHLDTPFNSQDITQKISFLLSLKKGFKILEIGCGCGFLARDLQHYNYTGIDYSEPIIKKHKSLYPHHRVLTGEGSSLAFPDKSFDVVFCFGVFQYLPSLTYADSTIKEMRRVAKKSIFLGDLKNVATRPEHFVYPKYKLKAQKFIFSECFYDPSNADRYNAHLTL